MSFKQDWEIERQLSWFATLRMASGALFFAREALICFAASLTLVIPFLSILFVYHAWGPDGQYELSPIITIFGRVDPRRFVSIWDNCNGRFRGVSGAPFPGSLSLSLSFSPSLAFSFVLFPVPDQRCLFLTPCSLSGQYSRIALLLRSAWDRFLHRG